MPEPSSKEITLAIRIDTARHAQLTWIAELRGTSLKAECFKAVDAYIEAAKNDPELMAKATAAREAIEAEAKARQAAIDNLFIATQPPLPDDQDTPVVAVEETAVDTDTVEATATADPDSAHAAEGEPPQGTRRSRGRRGGQTGGEQADS
ncbi:hypothetical protein [Nocardia brasiliensis]|uniref:hypothetical protein n=1 Tax=Nocardia brasiliensis TaxID=37326 RepID=UPI0024545AE7|nr:hypothetical protein [Nocardia brasiliensis]